MNFPYRYEPNSMLLNEGGKHFLPAEFTLGIEPRGTGSVDWFSVNCNGANGARQKASQVCNSPNAGTMGCRPTGFNRFTVLGSRGTRSAVIADVDNDGDLDIVTNEFNAKPQLLISDLSGRHHINFLKVHLNGTHANREGLGAQVTVVLPDHRRILEVMDGKSGYLTQSDLRLYFGLASADRASIEVRWPSGKRQTVAGPIAAGKTVEIVEQ